MYRLLRPFLFKLEPEKAHELTLSALHWLPSWLFKAPASSPVQALGLYFPHKIGLAAGLDKNAEHLDALAKLGFSFIEVGTVTPRPQLGNPKPRLFRLPEAQAIINRMGFNNQGVDALVERVKRAQYQGILGINIGKNKDTAITRAAEDYLYCMDKVYPYASYITVNISSPNTPDLRLLQQKNYLESLLKSLRERQLRLSEQHKKQVPLLVKLSPDESDETLKEIAGIILEQGIEGIIATNTTNARDAVHHLPNGHETGGLSGQPLFERSTHCLKLIKETVGDELCLIAVGGIDSLQTAEKKLNAGADLLQVYSGLIYKGPGMVAELSQL